MAEHAQPVSPDPKWLLHGDLPCLGCQYNLRGLVGPVVQCPECGHTNDLRDPSAWRTKALPTGLLVREHWPASAALASLVVMIVLPFVIIALGEWGLGALAVMAIFGAAVVWWLRSCVRWLRSCQNKAWGWGVLMGTHLAMWGILLGAIVPMGVMFAWPWALVGLALPVAFAAFFWLRAVIRKADEMGRFRADWRQWRLPTGAEGKISDL
ncbi:MAG: hypothetical protein WDZ31_10140 [Phycisphaeraceae bacterium]